jgi:hypothetical protein
MQVTRCDEYQDRPSQVNRNRNGDRATGYLTKADDQEQDGREHQASFETDWEHVGEPPDQQQEANWSVRHSNRILPYVLACHDTRSTRTPGETGFLHAAILQYQADFLQVSHHSLHKPQCSDRTDRVFVNRNDDRRGRG